MSPGLGHFGLDMALRDPSGTPVSTEVPACARFPTRRAHVRTYPSSLKSAKTVHRSTPVLPRSALAPRLNLRTKARKPEVSCRRPVPKLSKATVSQNPGVEADAWGRITSIGVGVGSSVMGIRFPHAMDHHHHRLGRSAGGWIRMEATPPVGAAMVRRSAQRPMPRGISRRLTPRVRSCARGLEPHTTPTLFWSAFITSDISLPNSLGTIRRAASIGLSGVYLRAV